MLGLDAQSPTATPRIAWAALTVVCLGLHGCGSLPSSGSAAPPLPPSAPAAPRSMPLEREVQWLQSWFLGTPVAIVQRDDGSVDVEVPSRHCFDSGSVVIRPALAAVLDKVAQSLRRNPHAHLQLLAAPGDEAADAGLALRRAAQVRSHLRSRGVAGSQLARPAHASAAAVQLHLAVAARTGG